MQRFGSAHTEEKLAKLEEYLKVYSTALKHQKFRLIYFDAFAGTGGIQVAGEPSLFKSVGEYSPFIAGSAHRALRRGSAFDEYIFVEKSPSKVRALRALKSQYKDIENRISIRQSDANSELEKFCAEMKWSSTRAVVFLDPYGNQVKWTTIEAIARTEAIDLWYLFPSGLGVHRQIGKDATVDATHARSLDELLGTKDWRNAFIEERNEEDLFGSKRDQIKIATPESITLFMIKRMKGVFKGGVLDEWLPLGSKGVHMYSLVFAWANPSLKAKLAGKLAEAVLRSTRRGRSK